MGVTTDLKKYLHSDEFRDDLVRQYARFEILSEGGLRTAVANLLHAEIPTLGHSSKTYRVTCETRLRLPGAQVVPDILIWKGKHPRIWIELKNTRGFNLWRAKRDWEKLQNYCKECNTVKAGYLVYVARRGGRDFPIKRDRKTMRYWLVPIALNPHLPDFETWEKSTKEERTTNLPNGNLDLRDEDFAMQPSGNLRRRSRLEKERQCFDKIGASLLDR
jgi:hypothetical protein